MSFDSAYEPVYSEQGALLVELSAATDQEYALFLKEKEPRHIRLMYRGSMYYFILECGAA